MYTNKNKQKGFIALVSAVLISAVLLIVAVTGSLTGFYARFGILSSEFKERSSALAEGCTSVLFYKLGEDSGYNGPDMGYPVGDDACSIFGATNPGGSPRVFKVRGIYQNSYTNLTISVDVDTLKVVSWQETAN